MIVAKELRSETKVFKPLYFKDLAFVFFYFVFSFMMRGLVSVRLQIPYLIFSLVLPVILSIRTAGNPGKRYRESLLIYLNRNSGCYYGVKNESKKMLTEDMLNDLDAEKE